MDETAILKRLLSYFSRGANAIPASALAVITALYIGRNKWLDLVTNWPYLTFSVGAALLLAALWRAELNGSKLTELWNGYQDIQNALNAQASSLSKVLDLIMSMVETAQNSTAAVTLLSNHIRSRPTPTQLQVVLEAHTALFVAQNVSAVLSQYRMGDGAAGSGLVTVGCALPADLVRSTVENTVDGLIRQVIQKSLDVARGTLNPEFASRMLATGRDDRDQLIVNLMNMEGSVQTRVTTAVVVSTRLAGALYETARSCILVTTTDLPLHEEP